MRLTIQMIGFSLFWLAVMFSLWYFAQKWTEEREEQVTIARG